MKFFVMDVSLNFFLWVFVVLCLIFGIIFFVYDFLWYDFKCDMYEFFVVGFFCGMIFCIFFLVL